MSDLKSIEKIGWRLLGIGAIAFGIALSWWAIMLFMEEGLHILPPVSYYIWGIIIVVDLASLIFGFALLVYGKPQKKWPWYKPCQVRGCEEVASHIIRTRDGLTFSVCTRHYEAYRSGLEIEV